LTIVVKRSRQQCSDLTGATRDRDFHTFDLPLCRLRVPVLPSEHLTCLHGACFPNSSWNRWLVL
jgi:hypothetical protein